MLSTILKSMNSSLNPHIRYFTGNHLLETRYLIEEKQFDFQQHYLSPQWKCVCSFSAVDGRADAVDLTFTFNALTNGIKNASVNVEFSFDSWSASNYVLIPGVAYNANRFESRPLSYPPILMDPRDIGVDIPTIITDVPRLNNQPGPSRIQQTTQDPATPAIGFYSPVEQKAVLILTKQQTKLGSTGIEIEENEERSKSKIVLSSPAIREEHIVSDHGADFEADDEVVLQIRLYHFPCQRIQQLFDRFAEIRKDLSGKTHLFHSLPFSYAWKVQEQKYNESNWKSAGGYYSIGTSDSPYEDWQAGWVGGGMSSFPLLMAGNELSRERAESSLNFLFSNQAKSGFFYSIVSKGKIYGDGFHREDSLRWHLIRKSADVLYFIIKHFILIEKQLPPRKIPDPWLEGTRRLADGFVRLWNRYGQFGQFVDIETGEIIVGGSTSAAMAPAGLALAGEYFNEASYSQTAIESAQQFYIRDTVNGVTTGGPGEILQCPDSESAFALLESYIVLFETSGDMSWISKAEEMANQCATWCVSYDFNWPEHSEFGRHGIRSSGSVIANAQNKHSAPGICTLSGDSLFKLYRATGNHSYLELLQEIAHNQTQYLSLAERPIHAAWDENRRALPPGWMCERVNLSDWEGRLRVGEVFYGSCWCEVSNMLAYVEVPGLYIQPDTGFYCMIDHLDAELIERGENYSVLKLTNPTHYEAVVRVFSESSGDALKPLGQSALYHGRQERLDSLESRIIRFEVPSPTQC